MYSADEIDQARQEARREAFEEVVHELYEIRGTSSWPDFGRPISDDLIFGWRMAADHVRDMLRTAKS